MIYLALSIGFSSLLFVVFKLFSRYKVNNLYAIIVNYYVASGMGGVLALNGLRGELPSGVLMNIVVFSGLLGILFILVFRLIALCSQQNGLRIASIATKMSLVIPAVLGILILKEMATFMLFAGIALAIAAIVLSNYSHNTRLGWTDLRLPLLVFFGSGLVDGGINLIRALFLTDQWFPLFTAVVFFSAGTAGILYSAISRLPRRIPPTVRDLAGGVALGVPNYLSLLFLLKSLDSPHLSSSVIFTANNVAIVLFSTLIGVLAFGERLNRWNYLGIGLAVLSILAVMAPAD